MKVEWKSCFRVGVSVFLLYLCITYWPALAGIVSTLFSAAMPLLIGCVIAYIINILMSFYEKHYFTKTKNTRLLKSRRPVCMLLAMITLVLIVVLVINLIVPQLTACVQLLMKEVPTTMKKITAWLESSNILPENLEEQLSAIDWKSKLSQLINILISGIGSVTGGVIGAVSSITSTIVAAVMALIFAIYLLLGKETIGGQCKRFMSRYLKSSWQKNLLYVLNILNDCFHRYVVGQCTEAVILGLLCMVGMFILRLPYAAMVGTLIALTALIPVAGAYIGGGIGAFMIFTVSPVKAVIFIVFLVILQQLEGNLIYPRVVGSSLGLPAIWVLAAVTLGGGVFGITGMLIGVPLAAAMYRLLREDVNRLPLKQIDN